MFIMFFQYGNQRPRRGEGPRHPFRDCRPHLPAGLRRLQLQFWRRHIGHELGHPAHLSSPRRHWKTLISGTDLNIISVFCLHVYVVELCKLIMMQLWHHQNRWPQTDFLWAVIKIIFIPSIFNMSYSFDKIFYSSIESKRCSSK